MNLQNNTCAKNVTIVSQNMADNFLPWKPFFLFKIQYWKIINVTQQFESNLQF